MTEFLSFALMTWWSAGLWWTMQQASGRQLANIRPAWRRCCAIFLTAPFYFTFVLFIAACDCASLLWRASANGVKVFFDNVKGIPQPEETEGGAA